MIDAPCQPGEAVQVFNTQFAYVETYRCEDVVKLDDLSWRLATAEDVKMVAERKQRHEVERSNEQTGNLLLVAAIVLVVAIVGYLLMRRR